MPAAQKSCELREKVGREANLNECSSEYQKTDLRFIKFLESKPIFLEMRFV